MVGFQVRKAHLDPLPLISGPLVLWRSHEQTRDVAGRFVDVAWYFALGGVWTTPRLQGARIAIELARPIADGAAVVNPACRTQSFTVRAGVLVLLCVESEVAAREGSIIAIRPLPHGDVRGDPSTDEPTEELAGPIGRVRHEALGFQTEPLFGALDHRPGGSDLVVGAGWRRLDIDDHGVLDVDQIVQPVAELYALVGLGRPCRTGIGRRDHLRRF